jgi:hypothetical protein
MSGNKPRLNFDAYTDLFIREKIREDFKSVGSLESRKFLVNYIDNLLEVMDEEGHLEGMGVKSNVKVFLKRELLDAGLVGYAIKSAEDRYTLERSYNKKGLLDKILKR